MVLIFDVCFALDLIFSFKLFTALSYLLILSDSSFLISLFCNRRLSTDLVEVIFLKFDPTLPNRKMGFINSSDGRTFPKVSFNLFSTTSNASFLSDKIRIDLPFKIASKAIADIVGDFPVPGGPSTVINFPSLLFIALNIFRCSSAKGIGVSKTNLSGVFVSSHSSNISSIMVFGFSSKKLSIKPFKKPKSLPLPSLNLSKSSS